MAVQVTGLIMSFLEPLKGVNILGIHGRGPQPLLEFLSLGWQIGTGTGEHATDPGPEGDASTEQATPAVCAAARLDNTVAASFFTRNSAQGSHFHWIQRTPKDGPSHLPTSGSDLKQSELHPQTRANGLKNWVCTAGALCSHALNGT